jgi:alpha-aminoadipate carrier protein LysW
VRSSFAFGTEFEITKFESREATINFSTAYFDIHPMVMVKCPVCGEQVSVDDNALPGEIVEHECGAQLEVFNDHGKLSLRLAEQVGEDWGE